MKKSTKQPEIDPVEQLIEYLKRVPSLSRFEGQQLSDEQKYKAQAATCAGYAVESERAAQEFSPGSTGRLRHMESAALSNRRSRACELVADGASIAAAVANVFKIQEESVAMREQHSETEAEASTEPKGGRRRRAKKPSTPATSAPSPPTTAAAAPPASSPSSAQNDSSPSAMSNTSDNDDGETSPKSNENELTGELLGRGVFRKTPRAQAERIVAGEMAAPDSARFYKVCCDAHPFDGLYGQETARSEDGWTVTLEIPVRGGDWLEESFDRAHLIPAAAELFAAQADENAQAESGDGDAHEFKPTTSLNGRCAVCRKESNTPEHRKWREQQKERERAGKPKQTATHWLTSANAKMARVLELRKYPFGTKPLTDARRRDWQHRLDTATEHHLWGETMREIARAVEAETLPSILNGLTNEYQVRQLMNCALEGKEKPAYAISNMGPTIKTPEDYKQAVEALRPFIPEVTPYKVDEELKLQESAKPVPDRKPEKIDAGLLLVETPVIQLARERFFKEGDIGGSYSGDKLVDADRIRQPFEHEGNLYVCVGGATALDGKAKNPFYSRADCYRVIPDDEPQEFPADVTGARHHGRKVKFGVKGYTMVGPVVIFQPEEKKPKSRAAAAPPQADTPPTAPDVDDEVDEDTQTEKGEAIVRQLVKCETTSALDEAISRYRLDTLDDVQGLTQADRQQIAYCIEIRRKRIAESETVLPVRCDECGYEAGKGHTLRCQTGQREEAAAEGKKPEASAA
jgi:hypothetical protein